MFYFETLGRVCIPAAVHSPHVESNLLKHQLNIGYKQYVNRAVANLMHSRVSNRVFDVSGRRGILHYNWQKSSTATMQLKLSRSSMQV